MQEESTDKLPRLRLKPPGMKRFHGGHPWVFSNELRDVPDLPPGTPALLDDPGGSTLCRGYFNPGTLISFRKLTRQGASLPKDWLEQRIAEAAQKREAVYGGEDCARLVFGEADGLPGLVVDRYGSILVVQILTAGMERLRPRIQEALRRLFDPEAIVAKDDAPVRELEGLPRLVGALPPEWNGKAQVSYLGLEFNLDLLEAQKTGLFLDQRENVDAFLRHVKPGEDVLDAFCYLGVWGMSALKAGARSAEFVDASARALGSVESQLAANGLPECLLRQGDALEILGALKRDGRTYGAVIVDPPAFAKSRKHLPQALKAYRRLNETAMALVKPGGLLVSCSCSYHLDRETFRNILSAAAVRAGRRGTLLDFRGQAGDHPVLLGFPEGDYLKCALIRLD
ncbi:MAG: class I SAM-dependent rRNA methyltransferase [Acidobacteriota bacterium]